MNTFDQHTAVILLGSLVVLLAPLLSALISWIVSSRYAWVLSLTSAALLLIGTVAAFVVFFYSWQEGPFHFNVPWFEIGDYTVTAGIAIDNLTLVMVVIVSLVSFLVHVYSAGYMADDMAIRQYFAMLGFFTFSMIGLVLADNLLLVFVFWELVGFSSYILIGHWMELPEAGRAATKAFIMNRIGDLGFVVGIMIVYYQTGSLQINLLESYGAFDWQTTAALCFFLGVIGKSAQFPLLTWLPDAMAGPTPVSALIHAATMVAAGVFLMSRIFFVLTPDSLELVTIVGAVTSLLGAGAALVQYDIKKILAYSTVSQLGLMILAIGVGARDSAILHLFTHAFFKAGLFLAAGSVIHAMHQAQQGTTHHFNVQDIRNLGGLRKSLPVTFLIFIACGASLSGIPFFSGFQSKDAIISAIIVWAGDSLSWRWPMVVIAFGITLLTVCYTYRLIWFVFIHPSSSLDEKRLSISETPAIMLAPMITLALCSLWWIVTVNPFSFSGWWMSVPESHSITVVSAIWVSLSIFIAYRLFKSKSVELSEKGISNALRNTFYLDTAYQQLIAKPISKLSTITLFSDQRLIDGIIHIVAYVQVAFAHFIGWFDRNIVDGTVTGIAYFSRGVGRLARSTQMGLIQLYIFWAGLGLIALLLYLIL